MRDVGQGEVIEQVPPVVLQGAAIGREQVAIRPSSPCWSNSVSSSIGTINGGSLMIRRAPFTVVSFPIACRLSRVWAFATQRWVALRLALSFLRFRALSVDLNSVTASSTSRCAYQTARIVWVAKARIALR